MRILVTGSSGFIGRHLTVHLKRLGHEVSGLDMVEPVAGGAGRFFKANLLRSSELEEVFRAVAPEGVIHLAAETGLDESRGMAGYAANIEGVRNLVEVMRAQGGVGRAVFTSTQLVCVIGYKPANDEDYAPHTLYGRSKVETERIVRGGDGGGAVWCLGRPTTVWGPGMNAHYQRFFRMIQRGRYFHTGSRPLLKSYAYVGNIVHQYERLLMVPAEQVHRRVFYLADYEPLSLRAWADGLARELGAPRIRTYPEGLVRLAAWVGDGLGAVGFRSFPFNSFRLKNILTEYVYDLAGTRRVCGELPYGMEEGIRETATWIRSLSDASAGGDAKG